MNNTFTSPIEKSRQTASMADVSRIEEIENKIKAIIEEDSKKEIPFFKHVQKGVIEKIAYFLSGCIERSVAIGIAGETASGKSTITYAIIDALIELQKKNNCNSLITRVNTDDYYYDRSEMVKAAGSFDEFVKNYDLDVPEAFELDLLKSHLQQLVEGKETYLPKYDMSGTALRYDNHTLAIPSQIIISEGLFTLTEKVRNVFDFAIYVDIEKQIQKERWYKRAAQRDLGESADRVYNNASEKAEIFIKPTMQKSDIVVNGEASVEDLKSIIQSIIEIAEVSETKELLLV